MFVVLSSAKSYEARFASFIGIVSLFYLDN